MTVKTKIVRCFVYRLISMTVALLRVSLTE